MNQVLYEASFEFEFAYLIPLIMLAFLIVFPYIMKACYGSGIMRIVKMFCLFAACFVVVWSLIVLFLQIDMYDKTVGAYKRGEYEVVEGYVEKFEPMPYEGHGVESFEIDGVPFW